jgi:hypothetical protein
MQDLEPFFWVFIMVDNLNIKKPKDPKTINTHEKWELDYWSKKFGVTKEQIKQSVKAVGNSTEKVKKHLGK